VALARSTLAGAVSPALGAGSTGTRPAQAVSSTSAAAAADPADRRDRRLALLAVPVLAEMVRSASGIAILPFLGRC
jgi:hypothetical protein